MVSKTVPKTCFNTETNSSTLRFVKLKMIELYILKWHLCYWLHLSKCREFVLKYLYKDIHEFNVHCMQIKKSHSSAYIPTAKCFFLARLTAIANDISSIKGNEKFRREKKNKGGYTCALGMSWKLESVHMNTPRPELNSCRWCQLCNNVCNYTLKHS